MMKKILKEWTLPIAIVSGVVAYGMYACLPWPDFARRYAAPSVAVLQPTLIFAMLFLSFCKINVRDLRPRISHLWLLSVQCGVFIALCLWIHVCPRISGRVMLESAMLCLICPTATAAAVVTQKLRGSGEDVTMYTLLVNLVAAVLIPVCIPWIYPQADASFFTSLMQILGKVFPMLICPLFAAQLVRHYSPSLCARLLSVRDLAFYLWAVSLSLAIAVTTRSIVHTDHSFWELAGVAAVSLACCAVQFAIGRAVGRHYGTPVSTSQALGQKNTVFAIWMGYTFMNPVTSMAGGFYSIWHNLYNTYQLRHAEREAACTSRSAGECSRKTENTPTNL